MLSARRVETPDLRTIDVTVRRLRHKITPELLVTQHGERATFSLGGVLIQMNGPRNPEAMAERRTRCRRCYASK